MATLNLGRVVGPPGEKGDKGEQGIQGIQGIQGPPGNDGATTSVNGVTHVGGAISLTQDNIPEGTTNKNFTATEKTKLSGIATGANKTVIANNLTETVAGKALDAVQGKALAGQISSIRVVKTARFVIGTSTSGWTTKQCDYLCDGTGDQMEINQAIQALPAHGGEVIILDGTYNITAKINVNKSNVSIRGNGNATVLKRMFNFSSNRGYGCIEMTGVINCSVSCLILDGNLLNYTNNSNYGVYVDASDNNLISTIKIINSKRGIGLFNSNNNNISNNIFDSGYYGIRLGDNNKFNLITNNNVSNFSGSGISLYGVSSGENYNNLISGNISKNNSKGIELGQRSSGNTITGNVCKDNDIGIYLGTYNSLNLIVGNTCTRGTGLATDYTESQYTIQLKGMSNSYNQIAMNNCMGKAVTTEGGTGNTLVNNKFDEA